MKKESAKWVKKQFQQIQQQIFWPNDISQFLTAHRREWGSSSVSITELLKFLIDENLLTRAKFTSNEYKPIVRYILGKHSIYELGLSLQRDSFLSHRTALAVHGVVTPEPTIYVNREQSPKAPPSGITQAGIRFAFKKKQRQSKYIFRYSAANYVLLSGKNTGRAGITRAKTPTGEISDVTDKERTLIDIVVRPAYAGGIDQVADAYAKAANEIDIHHLIDLLQRFDHAYPYHQAIGFLLERAGRSAADCRPLEALRTEFDFYLDYGMKRATLNKKWRLYYPASFD